MIVDVPTLLRRVGLPARRVRVLVERQGHLVVRAETARGPVVLKASTDPGAIVPDAENARFLAAAGLPVPAVLAQGEEPLSFVVLRWIDGDGLGSTSPVRAQREAGELLRRIHELEGGRTVEAAPSWDDWMHGWLNVILPWWGDQEGTEPGMVDEAWRAFEELRPLLSGRGEHFMLFDGRADHFLVRDGRIVGLVDVHDARRPGDAAMDLAVMGVLDEELMRNVREGYPGDAEELEAIDALVPFYLFLRRMAAAEWHGRFGPEAVAREALRRSIADPLAVR